MSGVRSNWVAASGGRREEGVCVRESVWKPTCHLIRHRQRWHGPSGLPPVWPGPGEFAGLEPRPGQGCWVECFSLGPTAPGSSKPTHGARWQTVTAALVTKPGTPPTRATKSHSQSQTRTMTANTDAHNNTNLPQLPLHCTRNHSHLHTLRVWPPLVHPCNSLCHCPILFQLPGCLGLLHLNGGDRCWRCCCCGGGV